MISTLRGRLVKKKDSSLLVDVGGVGYEVLVPITVLSELKNSPEGSEIDLITYHYHATSPSRSIPVIIGFVNEIEKEFFEKFITVSGIGPKAAVKAINKPMSEIAKAIDTKDIAFLKSLPGIGEQKANEIIAKLQSKIGKYGLIQDSFFSEDLGMKQDIEKEAVQVLIQLQYKKQQAEDMVKKAIDRNPGIKDSEGLLNEVYRQKRQDAHE